MATSRVALSVAAYLALTGLTGCSVNITGYDFQYKDNTPIAMSEADIIYIDGSQTSKLANENLAKTFLNEADYAKFRALLTQKRDEATYQNIEFQYNQAYLNWYNKYLTAFSLGIIDANGVPTGKIEDIRYTLDAYTKEEVIQELATCATAQEFISKLQAMYFITEGPDTSSELPDVLFYQFSVTENDTTTNYGFSTVESVLSASLADLQQWFNKFTDVELANLSIATNKTAMTAEELQQVANSLLASTNFQSPHTDASVVSMANGQHGISRDYLQSIATDDMNRKVATINIYGIPVKIQVESDKAIQWDDIEIEHILFNEQDVQENEAVPIEGYEFSLSVNEVPIEFTAVIDEQNKLAFTDTETLSKILVTGDKQEDGPSANSADSHSTDDITGPGTASELSNAYDSAESANTTGSTANTAASDDESSNTGTATANQSAESSSDTTVTTDEWGRGNSHSADMHYGEPGYESEV